MTTAAPSDMIRMQNPNQAKRCLPEMVGAAIFIPERRIPSHTLLSFACGITAAPRKAEVLQAGHFAVPSRKEGDFSMYQKIKAKFKASPTIFYACSIVASWAGVGSLMNFRTIALRYGAVPAIIWAVFNSLAFSTGRKTWRSLCSALLSRRPSSDLNLVLPTWGLPSRKPLTLPGGCCPSWR